MPVYRATLFIKADPSVDPLDLLSDLDDLEMPTDPEPIGTIDHSLARLEGPNGRRYGDRIWRDRLGSASPSVTIGGITYRALSCAGTFTIQRWDPVYKWVSQALTSSEEAPILSAILVRLL